jgi:hypothetical protein
MGERILYDPQAGLGKFISAIRGMTTASANGRLFPPRSLKPKPPVVAARHKLAIDHVKEANDVLFDLISS